MAFSAAPPNDELLASALEDSAQLELLPLSHDASVNSTAMASMVSGLRGWAATNARLAKNAGATSDDSALQRCKCASPTGGSCHGPGTMSDDQRRDPKKTRQAHPLRDRA